MPSFFTVTVCLPLAPTATLPKATADGLSVTSGEPVEKVAVAALALVIVTEQTPVPAHAPPQPVRVPPLAVSVTLEPLGKLAEHVPAEHVMPAGVLVTVPGPETVTDRV